jgi:hypothetical protein
MRRYSKFLSAMITLLTIMTLICAMNIFAADNPITVTGANGTIRIISASLNGIQPESSLYKITFNVKDIKSGTKEQFKLSDIKLGTAPEGTIIQSVGNSITVICGSDETTLVKKLENEN